MKKYSKEIGFLIVLLLIIVLSFWKIPLESFKDLAGTYPVWGGVIFVFLMVLSTVVPPITLFVLVPFVGFLLGSFVTFIYSVLGWTIGSMISFLIARRMGKPFLEKYISLKKVESYEEKLSGNQDFWLLVFLRMILPVDFLSYAVGLLTQISFWKFSLATFIGVIPFSFVFSYGYDIFSGDRRVILFALISFIIIGVAYLICINKKNV